MPCPAESMPTCRRTSAMLCVNDDNVIYVDFKYLVVAREHKQRCRSHKFGVERLRIIQRVQQNYSYLVELE